MIAATAMASSRDRSGVGRGAAAISPSAPAFEDVYRQHRDAVFRFCLSQVRDVPAAEDLAADVFAAAFAAYERARPDADGVRAWLFRIARNAAVDHHRRTRRRRMLAAILASRREERDVEREAGLRRELRAVIDAIDRLGERDRALLGLRLAGGLSHAEIAHVMGMREEAARMGVHRALRRVRDEVGERG